MVLCIVGFNNVLIRESTGIGLDPDWGNIKSNTLVCTSANSQTVPQLISDGQGGAFVAWTDSRGVDQDIYAQHLDQDGNSLWTDNGTVICSATGNQQYPRLVSDGQGGAIIVWRDYRSGNEWDIYAQRINTTGDAKWTNNGVLLSTGVENASQPKIVTDGQNGAIITWSLAGSGSNIDVYAQRINSTGDIQWGALGAAICIEIERQSDPRLVSDGAGGAIIAWRDRRNGPRWNLYSQRINSTGDKQWSISDEPICTGLVNTLSHNIASDGAQGAIITWVLNNDIFAQRINSSGDVQWTFNGIPICSAANSQDDPEIVSDGENGAIITWRDGRQISWDLFAQKVNANGVPQWEENGTEICNASEQQNNPRVVNDGQGGAIIVWDDFRNNIDLDIYTQRINRNGNILWGTNGTLVCNTSGDQNFPALILDDLGGVIIVWTDGDIYAQRLGMFITTLTPPLAINEDIYYYYDFNSNDDPNATWTLNDNATWLKINSNTGVLNGTPNNSYVGWYWIDVNVEDNTGLTDHYNFTITVSNVNNAPNITTPNIESATEDVYYSQTYNATDIDPTEDTLIWQIETNASSWLEFDTNSLVLNGTPTNDHVGWYWVNISVNDGNGGEDNTSFKLKVINENDPPTITTLNIETATEDEYYSVIYVAEDIDPTEDTLTWTFKSNGTSWLQFNNVTGLLNGTPSNEDVGSYWVNITVNDTTEIYTTNFTLSVINVNDPPEIITEENNSAVESDLYSVDYEAIDVDPTNDKLTWSLESTTSSWLNINETTGILSGTPTTNDVGEFYVNVTVSDGKGGIAWQNFSLVVKLVSEINQDPKITTNNKLNAEEGKEYSTTYEATDDRTSIANLIWSMTTNATWLSFDNNTKILSGTPPTGAAGKYWVNITVSDIEDGFASTNFTITVKKPFIPKPDNNKPELTEGKMEPSSGDTKTDFTFAVTYTDADNESGTVWLWIGDNKYEMTKDHNDDDYTDGVKYTYRTKLGEGNHSYYFTADDGTDDAVAGDTKTPINDSTAKSTPEIIKAEEKEEKEKDGQDYLMLIIIAIIIVIVLLLIIALALRKKEPVEDRFEKEKEEEEFEDVEEEMECPECGAIASAGEVECPECGAELEEEWEEEEVEDEDIEELEEDEEVGDEDIEELEEEELEEEDIEESEESEE